MGAAWPRWKPWLIALGIFLLNAYICRELFVAEWLTNLDSNEGAFIALARFYRDHPGEQWFPWFNAGSPIENAYQPLLPALGALFSWTGHLSPVRAMHLLLALVYCLGPISLFWFAWDWSRSLALSAGAALAYSLLSPAEVLIPILGLPFRDAPGSLRLYNIVHYAEDPHNLALTLLPVALLFMRRAMTTPTSLNVVGAIVSSGSVVAANAFGAVDLAIGGLAIALATQGGFLTLAVIGLAGWILISPWLPSSLIGLIGHGQWGAAGQMQQSYLGPAVATAVFGCLIWATRRIHSEFERFAILFAYWLCMIPLLFFHFKLTLVPQGGRYQLELELATCLLLGALFARALRHSKLWLTGLVLLAVAAAGVRQTIQFRRFARNLITSADISQTIEYKTCHWLDQNLRGQRAMIAGDTAFLCNALWDDPQLGAGHEPSAPNWMQQVATYIVYTGTPASDPQAAITINWLKAFGVSAIAVPGAKSREHYHPVAVPQRFEGILPTLWHDEDDTIYAVPQRSPSLARVIPRTAIVARAPIHGLDADPLRTFIAALDDPELPLAQLRWDSASRGTIYTNLKLDQVISLAVNYAPGWRASVAGRKVPVIKDAIGLTVVSPGCNGPCQIEIEYGPPIEAWICRILSALVTLGLCFLLVRGIYAAIRKAPPLRPSPHSANA